MNDTIVVVYIRNEIFASIKCAPAVLMSADKHLFGWDCQHIDVLAKISVI